MKQAAQLVDFEEAARQRRGSTKSAKLRDQIRELSI